MKPVDMTAELKRTAELVAGADALMIDADMSMDFFTRFPECRGFLEILSRVG